MSTIANENNAEAASDRLSDRALNDFDSKSNRNLDGYYEYPPYMQYAEALRDQSWSDVQAREIGRVELPPDLYPTDAEIESLPASVLIKGIFVGSDRARNLAIGGAIDVVGYHNDLIAAATEVHNIATSLRRQAADDDTPNNEVAATSAEHALLIAFAEHHDIDIVEGKPYSVEDWDIHLQSILLWQERMINDAKVSTYDVELYMGELATVVQISAKVLSAFGSMWRNIVQGMKLQ